MSLGSSSVSSILTEPPPIGPIPSVRVLLSGDNRHAEVRELCDRAPGILSPRCMPVILWVRGQAFSRLPECLCPGLEERMGLRPGVAFPHRDLVANVLTTFHLRSTHPFTLKTTGKPFPIEDGASSFGLDAPDSRARPVVGPSIRRVLGCACSQLHGQTSR